jgi:hypothetical protein
MQPYTKCSKLQPPSRNNKIQKINIFTNVSFRKVRRWIREGVLFGLRLGW